jgi:hypothetical protein
MEERQDGDVKSPQQSLVHLLQSVSGQRVLIWIHVGRVGSKPRDLRDDRGYRVADESLGA